MTWPVALTVVLVWLTPSLAAMLGWWLLRRSQQRRRTALPPPEERPDYRLIVPVARTCPECGASFERSPVVVDPLCDVCVRRRFDASVVADKVKWMQDGWEEKG